MRCLSQIFSLTLFLTFTACSLQKSDHNGIKIHLAPPAALSIFSLAEDFNLLTTIPMPSGLTKLHCFGVNVRSDIISTKAICNGAVQHGISAGMLKGIDSTFELQLPVGDGMIFEAFGTAGPTCESIGDSESTTESEQNFKIGSITASATDLEKEVIIPVSFNHKASFGCTELPYTVFSDEFTGYTLNTLSLVLNAPGIWQADVTPNDFLIDTFGGKLTMAAVGRSNFVDADLDTTKPYYKISVDGLIGATAGGGSPVAHSVGIATSNSSLANSIGCTVSFVVTQVTPATLAVGSVSTSLFPSAGSSGAIATPGGKFSLECEIKKQSDGTWKVIGQLFDLDGNSLGSPVIAPSVADVCGATGCPKAFLAYDPGGAASNSGTFDDYEVEQADLAQ